MTGRAWEIQASSKTQHIRDLMAPGLLPGQPLCGLEGAVNEGVAIGGNVGKFQPFAQRGKINVVPAGFIAHAEGVYPHLTAFSWDVVTMTTHRQLLASLAGGGQDGVGQ